jgi:hypothetical protein
MMPSGNDKSHAESAQASACAESADLEAAWIRVIEQRIADIEAGRVTLIEGDEALRTIRQRRRARS